MVTSTVAVAAFVPPIVIVMTALMVVLQPATLERRLWLGVVYVALAALAGALWRVGVAARHAVPYSMALVLALTATSVVYWRLLPETPDGAISTMLVIQMGTALLFPWGAAVQSVVCGVIVVGYAWLVYGAPETFQVYSAGLLVSTAPLMVFASHLISGYRSAAFLRDWQKDQLVSLTREVGTQLDLREVSAAGLTYGIRLLHADSGLVAVRVHGRSMYRIEAVAPAESDWLGLEMADDFGLLARVGSGVFVLPGDDPTHPFLPVLAAENKRHAIYAAVREGHEVAGVLALTRSADAPFRSADRSLAQAVADQAGLAIHTMRVIHDLKLANQLKTEFVSTMSHELRTPLNVILGYAEMAIDRAVDSTDRDDCLRRITASGRDLLELIESTLEIGKLEAGRQGLRREPVSLPDFWRQLVDACERLPRRPEVALEMAHSAPAVTVDTDPRKLNIIVRNLVGNGLKFTERGHVRVDIACEPAALTLRVSDTGIGISPENRETIFEIFRQADGSDARRYGGVGLGLYIVRRFVEQLGGTIGLESTLGRGTTFIVSLPGAAAA